MSEKNSNLEREPLNKVVKKCITAFITEWETTSVGESITIPINPNFNYNYNVDWGDGSTSTETTDATHTYDTQGIHTVKITGDFPAIFFLYTEDKDKDKIKKITNWGTIKWKSFLHAFNDCSNLELTATDSPDLSRVTGLSGMFANAANFNTNINHWDVSSIINIDFMFENATNFNQPLNSWNTSSVSTMNSMFINATNFNQPLNSWDTSGVVNMQAMFQNASSFTNQDLSGWDVDNIVSYAEFNTDWGTGNTLPDF